MQVNLKCQDGVWWQPLGYVLTAWLAISLAAARAREPSQVPGTVIAHYPKSQGRYVGSPGIAVVGDGVYLAKHDEFGPNSTEHRSAITHLYRSEDAGKTWNRTHTFDGLFWASIFTHADTVYLLGTHKHHGNLVILRSRDGGKTWTTPTNAQNGILREGENHTAPVPVVVHRGRVWRAVEDASNGTEWGRRYSAMMMSAPVDADLLSAANWTFSNYLKSDPSWLDGGRFNAWLEGNAVVTPDNRVVNLLRVDYNPEGEVAAVVRVSDDGRTITFDPQKDIIKFPGGAVKFTIRHDPVSKMYWTLCNMKPAFVDKSSKASHTRNTLALANSPDLRDWTVRSIVLYHPEVEHHAFQYVDWLFEGSDMIVASRTAYDDGQGGAKRAHDANYLTFHRLRNFRELAMADSPAEYLQRANEARAGD